MALLRYFNPIGAHKSGLIGEDPNGIPNNLMPYIAKVAVGKLEKVHVFGNDYPTPDGTGVRDYIHVVDLARGHVCAIRKLQTNCGLFICNLGTGHGYSVLDVLHAFEKACGKKLPYVIDPRRPGDIAECYADPTKAKNELGWVAEYGIEEMCADSWNWQKKQPRWLPHREVNKNCSQNAPLNVKNSGVRFLLSGNLPEQEKDFYKKQRGQARIFAASCLDNAFELAYIKTVHIH